MIFSGFSGNAVPVIPRTVNAETFVEEVLWDDCPDLFCISEQPIKEQTELTDGNYPW